MKNFRDFGLDNVRKGVFFRGEAISKLSNKDKTLLFKENNIKVVIDLRSIQEKESKPDFIPNGVSYYHLPFLDMLEMGSNSEKEAKKEILKTHKLPDMHRYYTLFVSKDKRESWTKIFELLLTNEGPFYFHCTAGKDRTGTLAALLLALLGVDKDKIVLDYLETNKHTVFPFAYRVFALTLDKETRKEFKTYIYAKEEYLDTLFLEINRIYGSLEGFYKDCCGLDEDKIKALKNKYLAK